MNAKQPDTPAQQQPGKKTLKDWLGSEKFHQALAEAAPKHLKPDRMLRIVTQQLARVPKLRECTQESFLAAVIDATTLGIEPDGRFGHLLPYFNKKEQRFTCKLIVDYKGMVDIAYRSGRVRDIGGTVVYEGDEFDYDRLKVRHHRPWAWIPLGDRPEERGEVLGAFLIVSMDNGAEHHEVMTLQEIEDVRARSQSPRGGPWVTDWNAMALKSVMRRAFKWIPTSVEIRESLAVIDRHETVTVDGSVSKPRSRANGGLLEAMQESATFTTPDDDDGAVPVSAEGQPKEQTKK